MSVERSTLRARLPVGRVDIGCFVQLDTAVATMYSSANLRHNNLLIATDDA
jgi:hypothetical protein